MHKVDDIEYDPNLNLLNMHKSINYKTTEYYNERLVRNELPLIYRMYAIDAVRRCNIFEFIYRFDLLSIEI